MASMPSHPDPYLIFGSQLGTPVTAPPLPVVFTAYILDGQVTSVYIDDPGAGYASAPTITLTGGNGATATGVAALSGTGMASIAVTGGGSGYSTPPVITITGGGGSGATGTAVLLNGSVSSITTTAGSGYTSIPTVAIAAPGTTATATCTINSSNGSVVSATVTSPGSNYTSAPTVTLSGSSPASYSQAPNGFSVHLIGQNYADVLNPQNINEPDTSGYTPISLSFSDLTFTPSTDSPPTMIAVSPQMTNTDENGNGSPFWVDADGNPEDYTFICGDSNAGITIAGACLMADYDDGSIIVGAEYFGDLQYWENPLDGTIINSMNINVFSNA